MKNIIFPTDFSDNSINAIRYGLNLLKGERIKITLFNTYDIPVVPTVEQTVFPVNYVAELVEASEKGLERMKVIIEEDFDLDNMKVELVSKMGPLRSAVIDFLEDNFADLIIMGTYGGGGLKQLLVGSNTLDIMKIANCPVLSIPTGYKFTVPKNIVFSTDLQPISNTGFLNPVKWIAKKFSTEVRILNVSTDFTRTDKKAAAAALKIDSFLKELNHYFDFANNVTVEEGIMHTIEENNCDLLVMVIHDLNFFERLFHPSITRKIAMQVDKPLLTLHA